MLEMPQLSLIIAKKKGFGIRIRMSKKAPKSDNLTSVFMYVVVKGNAKQKIYSIVESKL